MIPKIEWNNIQVTGETVVGSNVISNIADTSGLEPEMLIKGTAFPSGTKILSVGVDNVTMTNNSTDATIEAREFFNLLDFTYPSVVDDGEYLLTKKKERTSLSGIRQIDVNYLEYDLPLEFDFLTKDQKDEIMDFYKTHASLGGEFRYYEDKESTEYVDYEAKTLNPRPQKTTPTLYKIKMLFRRVES